MERQHVEENFKFYEDKYRLKLTKLSNFKHAGKFPDFIPEPEPCPDNLFCAICFETLKDYFLHIGS